MDNHTCTYIIYCPFKALAEGSLSLARAHAVLDETEKSLEHEIERESRKPPNPKSESMFYEKIYQKLLTIT